MAQDPLGMDAETMRRLGYRTVDMLVDELSDPAAIPLRRATPDEMRARLGGPPPDQGEDFDALLERLREDVLPFMGRSFHPGFFAFIPSNGTWPGALGDFVASALNIYAGSWMESAGPSQLELDVLDWFKQWIGYPPEAAGVLVSGGSAANMTALACAREHLVGAMDDSLVAYVADQAHSSLARAGRVLGFRPDQMRVLPVDRGFRMIPRMLAGAIDADRRAGRTPLFVSASAGATNTGAIDPLPEIAEICRERGVWFHADAAYGGFSMLTERGRHALAGIELADSVTMDPHKWLYQPFECGCLLVRDGERLHSAFTITPDYLKDAEAAGGEVNFADLGIQLTRASRALKLWLSLRAFGVDAFRAAIERALDLAEGALARVQASAAFELMAPPSLATVCFRRRFEGVEDPQELDRLNARLVAALETTGMALVSSTRLRGRYAIRLCVLNHTTGEEDVQRTLDFLETAAVARGPIETEVAEYQRDPDIRQSWLAPEPANAGERPEPDVLSTLPLFAGLSADEIERAVQLAVLRDVDAGDTIVEQWQVSRDFFVIATGGAEVRVDGEPVALLGPGDIFGELAALEWARGFGYPRLASVVATAPSQLVVFADGALHELVRDLPSVRETVMAAVHERLPQE